MKLHFVSSHPEMENVQTFKFEPEQPIAWQPGQYMHYVLENLQPDDKGNERWFTISTAPFEKLIAITTRLDNLPFSNFKQALVDMKAGDMIEADGPKGQFVLQDGDRRHVLIAGGIGITPFRSMLAELAHNQQSKTIDLLYANRDNNFVFGQELKDLQSNYSSLTIKEFVDRRLELDDFKPYLSDSNSMYYLSGPRSMVESYQELLIENGVLPEQIMTDFFPGYP
jgi:ferredoxin-NADP reductase